MDGESLPWKEREKKEKMALAKGGRVGAESWAAVRARSVVGPSPAGDFRSSFCPNSNAWRTASCQSGDRNTGP